MQITIPAIATAGVLALALAGPAVAHEGHSSCSNLAHTFIVPGAQSGQLGAVAAQLGRAGTLDETVQFQHSALCRPK